MSEGRGGGGGGDGVTAPSGLLCRDNKPYPSTPQMRPAERAGLIKDGK